MKPKLDRAALAAGVITSALCGVTASQAQSSDALLDKLVSKGILTAVEAKELRAETERAFTKAYQVKSGMPDWVTSLKINGDLRTRYERIWFDNAAAIDRQRFRYRVRLSLVAVMKDDFEVGLRLTSGEPVSGFGSQTGSPLSGNSTFQDNGSRKFAYIDLVYGKWRPIHDGPWMVSTTVGKMENPFVYTGNIFDKDYNPEGAALQISYQLNKDHTLRLNSGAFVLDELAADSNDPYLLGAQVRLDSAWSKALKSSLGAGVLSINNSAQLTTGNVPDANRGNTRTTLPGPNAALFYHFNPVIGDGSLLYTLDSFPAYHGAFPIRVGGEFLHNLAAPAKNNSFDANVTFGKAGKKGQWELIYRYSYIEADSWYEELTDDDFGAFYKTASNRGAAGYSGGTNTRGHWVRLAYSPYDALTWGVAYYDTKLISMNPGDSDSGVSRLQFDMVWRF